MNKENEIKQFRSGALYKKYITLANGYADNNFIKKDILKNINKQKKLLQNVLNAPYNRNTKEQICSIRKNISNLEQRLSV